MKLAPVPGLLAVLATVSLTGGLRAQDKELEREIDYITLLAKDWGFVELSTDLLEDLRTRVGSDSRKLRLLGRVDAEVSYYGSKRIRDLDRKEAELQKALQKFDDYLGQYGDSERAVEVRKTLAEACEYYGQFLAGALEVTTDPDKRKEIEDRALEVFIKGTKAANEAISGYEAQQSAGQAQARVGRALAGLRKGSLMIEWARTIEKDRKIKAEEAIAFLEDMILDFGEETAIGVKCLLMMGEASDIVGRTEDAISLYKDTIRKITERLSDDQSPIPASTAQVMWQINETGFEKLTAIRLRTGDIAGVLSAVGKYEKDRQKFGFPVGLTDGDLLMLNGAQAMFESGEDGGKDKAIETAQNVARRHPGDYVGLKARKLLDDILSSPGSANVSASALFEAANGDYQEERWQEAIRGFKRVLRNLESADDKAKFGLRSYAQMGVALARMDRELEAFFAFYQGLEEFGRDSEKKYRDLAVQWLKNMARRKAQVTKDSRFEHLERDADLMITRFGDKSDKNRIFWDQAEGLRQGGKFAEAIAKYDEISKEFTFYELSMVRKAVCLYEKGQGAAANKAFEAYYEYTKDPLNEATQGRPAAIAEARFYQGLMAADAAFGLKGAQPDKARLEDVVTAFRGFRDNYQGASKSLNVISGLYLVRALVEKEELEDAEAEFRGLRKAFPDDSSIAALAKDLFMARKTIVDALREELDKADKSDPRAIEEAEAKFKVEAQKALAFATQYAREEPEPDFAILRYATQMAIEIKDWDTAQFLLEKTLSVYKDTKRANERLTLDKYASPELADILVRKHQFARALELIEKALPLAKGELKYDLIRLKARTLGGWCEIDRRFRLEIVPGRGEGDDYKTAYELMWVEYRKFVIAKYEQYSLEWYRFYFECMDYALKQASKGNSDYKRFADTLYNNAKSVDDFGTLKKLGKDGEQLHRLFELRNR
ncbi:MAG: hypothetical protein R3F30_11035 [Planctomycetota bacterium]